MRPLSYPFSAIVGQEAMKTALLLNAVDPTIGGVLIRGHKGTGKSTAARALARLLPEIQVVEGCPFNSDPASGAESALAGMPGPPRAGPTVVVTRPTPFVELPLNATEDRLVGSLHVEKALATGQRHFEPGLLAAANRGVLYVDEVNLLDDHLVDMLLDAAASGSNVIEREGLSLTHPARFMLIGTMNPEEGDLRPQFLDRFGLCVNVRDLEEIEVRETIVRWHLAFERAPEDFQREWRREEDALAAQIVLARALLPAVRTPEALVTRAVRLTLQLAVQGHRADITLLKAARAHAALLERDEVQLEDVLAAAHLALPHRVAQSPLDSAEQLGRKIDAALRRELNPRLESELAEEAPAPIQAREDPEFLAEQMQIPGSAAAGSILFSFLKKKSRKPCLSPTSG